MRTFTEPERHEAKIREVLEHIDGLSQDQIDKLLDMIMDNKYNWHDVQYRIENFIQYEIDEM